MRPARKAPHYQRATTDCYKPILTVRTKVEEFLRSGHIQAGAAYLVVGLLVISVFILFRWDGSPSKAGSESEVAPLPTPKVVVEQNEDVTPPAQVVPASTERLAASGAGASRELLESQFDYAPSQ